MCFHLFKSLYFFTIITSFLTPVVAIADNETCKLGAYSDRQNLWVTGIGDSCDVHRGALRLAPQGKDPSLRSAEIYLTSTKTACLPGQKKNHGIVEIDFKKTGVPKEVKQLTLNYRGAKLSMAVKNQVIQPEAKIHIQGTEINSAKTGSGKEGLKLKIAYGGGCEKHSFKLKVAKPCSMSTPKKCTAELVHRSMDMCEALLTKDLNYSLEELGLDNSLYSKSLLTIVDIGSGAATSVRLPEIK